MAVVLTCGAFTVARAQILAPEESGMVTVAGCLQIRDADHKDQYILANPVPGPVDSVPDGRCSATIDERAFDLDKTHKSGMNESLLGHFVEINGRLEKETHVSLDNLRELSALSFRVVPVVPPQVEVAVVEPIAPPPIRETPTPRAETRSEETPVATTGTTLPATLPKTASPLPGIGLLGLFGLAGGLALRVNRLHQRG
jgi:hypothetical protein